MMIAHQILIVNLVYNVNLINVHIQGTMDQIIHLFEIVMEVGDAKRMNIKGYAIMKKRKILLLYIIVEQNIFKFVVKLLLIKVVNQVTMLNINT